MDTGLYFRVIWRFRVLVAAGLAAAIFLSFLAMVRIGFSGGAPKLSYRQPITYQADTLLLVTQTGFPWGRTVLPSTQSPAGSPVPQGSFADPGRFSQLAGFYAQLANGDAVQFAIKRDPSFHGAMQAMAVPDPTDSNQNQPIIDIQGLGETRGDAVRLSAAGAELLRTHVAQLQQDAGIPEKDRVLIKVLKRPDKLLVVVPRKKTIPILVFMAIMTATIGTAFLLENMRPRLRPVRSDEDDNLRHTRQIA